MPNKSISLSGEVHISTEQVYTTVDALEALKAIGLAYGLYSRAEELRGQRVHLTGVLLWWCRRISVVTGVHAGRQFGL